MDDPTFQPASGQMVLVRGLGSGVHAGALVGRDGQCVELADSRRLWRWHTGGAGVSLSEVSLTGIDASKSKICAMLPKIIILDAVEIIPLSLRAADSIRSAKVYVP